MNKITNKILLPIIIIALVLTLSSCKISADIPDIKSDADRPYYQDTKTLVIYFSQPDNVDDSTVSIDEEVFGNTQYMAYVIQDNTKANIFRIIPTVKYPSDHQELVDIAQEEKTNNLRPEISERIENFSSYDNIFIGYPNWWGDMPMILYTLFDEYDFSGKTIIPFNTHGGSGFSNTIDTIKTLEPNAVVKEGLSISRNNIGNQKDEIIEWIEKLELKEETTTTSTNILIVYFSWSTTGNTEKMANYITEKTNGDIVEIIPEIPYIGSYNDVAYGRAQEEHENNARPAVSSTTYDEIDINKYETIFIGYPIWWHTAPMIIGTFLEHYQWTENIHIYPFSQSASMDVEQFNESIDFIKESAKGATIDDGLFTNASNTEKIDNYLATIHFN